MKKFWKVLLPCLLCGALLAVCTGCSGYESESIAYTGEEGSMVFLGVNFNGTNSRSDGVKIQVNFAHESVSEVSPLFDLCGHGRQFHIGLYSAALFLHGRRL